MSVSIDLRPVLLDLALNDDEHVLNRKLSAVDGYIEVGKHTFIRTYGGSLWYHAKWFGHHRGVKLVGTPADDVLELAWHTSNDKRRHLQSGSHLP